MTKVGLPGAKEGLSDLDPTIADLLKPHGYVCGQFGKNHVGDRNEHLPTVHGFDEFCGNLYHLNAEEEPEHPDYPKPEEYPNFRERFGPRGVLHTWARDKDDPKETAHFGAIGKQKIEDTGPLTKKRMETVDEEFLAGALDFMDKAHKRKKPFFVWWNSTRMHVWTHLKRRSQGKTGHGVYADGMVEHDGHAGVVQPREGDGRGPETGQQGLKSDHGRTTRVVERHRDAAGDRSLRRRGGTVRPEERVAVFDNAGTPPERVVGSSNGLRYTDDDHGGSVACLAEPDVFDHGPVKPVRIWSRIGRRPILGAGNSNGDIPMLRFAGGKGRPALRLLVLHDDPEREFEYLKGAETALVRAAPRAGQSSA